MTTRKWKGGAVPTAQITNITPLKVEAGDVFALKINERIITAESTNNSVSEIINSFVSSIGNYNNSIPEWAEVSASVGVDDSGNATHLVLTGLPEGKPFTVSAGSGTAIIGIIRKVAGQAGDNQQQMISIEGADGGTFTLTTEEGGPTGAVAYNATAGTVETAIETTGVECTVTGSAGGPWLVEFDDADANKDLNLIVGNGASLTKSGGYSVTVETLQNGSSSQNAIQAVTLLGTPTGGTWSLRYSGYAISGQSYAVSSGTLETALEGLTSIGAGNVSVSEEVDGVYLIEFIGDFAGEEVQPLQVATEANTVATPDGIVTITRTQTASSGVDAVYNITPGTTPVSLLVASAAGGEYSVSGIAVESTAVDVQEKLQQVTGLTDGTYVSNVNGQNRGTFVGGPWKITFIAGLGSQAIAVTSDNATVAGVTTGSATQVAEVQQIRMLNPGCDSGTYHYTYRFGWTGPPTSASGWAFYDATTLAGIAVFNNFLLLYAGATVTSTIEQGADALVATVTFDTTAHPKNVPLITVDILEAGDTLYYDNAGVIGNVTASTSEPYAGVSITPVQDSQPSINEVQRVSLSGCGGGTFTLTQDAQTTAGVSYDASAWAVKNALELLSTIDEVSVTSDSSLISNRMWLVEWPNGINAYQMTGSGASLTGGAVEIEIVQGATDPVDEVQTISLDDNPSGSFTLTFGGQTTSALVPETSALAMRSALETLSSIGVGNTIVVKTKAFNWDVKFVGDEGGQGQDLITSTSSLVSGGADQVDVNIATAATSGNHWDNKTNWTTTTVPAGGDDVYFEAVNIDCLYGLDQSTVTLDSLNIDASYTGSIGLQSYNGDYYEYRDTMLQIGATALNIGTGDGSGSSRIKIDVGTVQTSCNVSQTSTPDDESVGAFVFAGTHVANAVNIQRGTVGIATNEPGQDTKLASLKIGYVDDQENDANVRIGSDVSQITLIEQSAGGLQSKSNITTLTQRGGGGLIQGSATIGTLDVAGDVTYSSTGTITQGYVRSNGSLNFDRNTQARTVTNITAFAGSVLSDRNRTVTWTNPIVLSGCGISDVELELGTNITIDIATV